MRADRFWSSVLSSSLLVLGALGKGRCCSVLALAQVLHILWVQTSSCLAWQVPAVCTQDGVGVEQGAAGEVGMSPAFCAPSCGDTCSLWSWSGCANSTCLSQLQLLLLTGKFGSALGRSSLLHREKRGWIMCLKSCRKGQIKPFILVLLF